MNLQHTAQRVTYFKEAEANPDSEAAFMNSPQPSCPHLCLYSLS